MIIETINGKAAISTIGIVSVDIRHFKNSDNDTYDVNIIYTNTTMSAMLQFNSKDKAESIVEKLDKYIDLPINQIKEKSEIELFKDAIEYAIKLKGVN